MRKSRAEFVDVVLPWGLPLCVRPEDAIGRALRQFGVYDLAVSETLWRLIDPGETVVDVGANIGYTTAVLAGRLAREGEVLAFEPHPEVFCELERNVARWRPLVPGVRFGLVQAGLSDSHGRSILVEPAGFGANRGVARLEPHVPEDGRRYVEIAVTRLDDAMRGRPVHVMKLDVEGHESVVLRGASEIVEGRRVRDVIFEDSGAYPTAASEILAKSGYEIYRIHKSFLGPGLLAPDAIVRRSTWEPTSFLATLEPDRARCRLERRGWSILRGRDRSRA